MTRVTFITRMEGLCICVYIYTCAYVHGINTTLYVGVACGGHSMSLKK